MNINIPDVIQIPLGRNAKYGTMEFDFTKVAQECRERVFLHCYEYGVRQIHNDAMADKMDDDGNPLSDESIVAKAHKRRDTLYSGELRTHRASSEPVDPVDREAWRMAREKIEAQFRALKIWPAKGRDKFDAAVAERCVMIGREMTADQYIGEWLEKNPKVRTQAEKIVRERNRADAGELV